MEFILYYLKLNIFIIENNLNEFLLIKIQFKYIPN